MNLVLEMTYQPTSPDPNKALTLNPDALQKICSFPLASNRKDYTQSEWREYKLDWETFNQIWAYNYTVSTINGRAGNKNTSPYQFLSYTQRASYINGQSAHVGYYGNNVAFSNIVF